MSFFPCSIKEIEESLDTLAIAVAEHGRKYLPLYEIVEEEYNHRINECTILDAALLRAKKIRRIDTQNDTQFDTISGA